MGWALLAAFVVLASLLALTRFPQSDEGHFANAGYLVAQGQLPAMPMWADWIPSLADRAMINMPLYYYVLGAWYTLFDPTLVSARLLSVVIGAAGIVGWSLVGWQLASRTIPYWLALGVFALNYDLINFSSVRYDILAVSLAGWAVAWFGLHRDRVSVASGGAGIFAALACLSHPYGVLAYLGVGVMILHAGWRSFLTPRLLWLVVPGAVALLMLAAWIYPDWELFQVQLRENAAGRVSDDAGPFALIWNDIRIRYLERYAGFGSAGLAAKVRLPMLLSYLAALAICAGYAIRSRDRRPAMLVVAWVLVLVLFLAFAEQWHLYVYLAYLIPVLVVAQIVAAARMLGSPRPLWRRAAIGWLAANALFAVGLTGARVASRELQSTYVPAAALLGCVTVPGETVLSGGEFGPVHAFGLDIRNDTRLRSLESHPPVVIVLGGEFDATVSDHPKLLAMRSEFRTVGQFRAGERGYRVLLREERADERIAACGGSTAPPDAGNG